MFKDMGSIDIKAINRALWLSSPSFKQNPKKHDALQSEAIRIGEETSRRYPLNICNVVSELTNLGIKGIEYFAQSNGDRAYYLLDEMKIYLNSVFISEMTDYFKSQQIEFFSHENIMNALILHELFHHIEETLTKPTDDVLKNIHKTSVPPIYRDIAAFAFANAAIPGMICQVIDIFWLKMRYPEKYSHIEFSLKTY